MSNEAQKTPPVTATSETACASTSAMKSDCASTSAVKSDCATQEKAEKLGAEIKKAWNKLTDDDVKLLHTDAAQFFAKIKEKYSLTQEDAQKRLNEIKSAANACSAEKAA